MSKPHLFIGSSSANKDVVEQLLPLLEDEATCHPWHQGVFGLGQAFLESLLEEARLADAAIIVVAANDLLLQEGVETPVPRDNIVFELGLFMGALGRERTLVLAQKRNGIGPKLPSDLNGISIADFERDEEWPNCLAPAAVKIKNALRKRQIIRDPGPSSRRDALNGPLRPVSGQAPQILVNEFEALFAHLKVIHDKRRLGVEDVQYELGELVTKAAKYKDPRYTVPFERNVREAYTTAQTIVVANTTPRYLDNWERGDGLALLHANGDFIRRNGCVIRFFHVNGTAAEHAADRDPVLHTRVAAQLRQGIEAYVVCWGEVFPNVWRDIFRRENAELESRLECALVDGQIFMETVFASPVNQVSVVQDEDACCSEYKSRMLPLLKQESRSALYRPSMARPEADVLTLSKLSPEEIAALRARVEDLLGLQTN